MWPGWLAPSLGPLARDPNSVADTVWVPSPCRPRAAREVLGPTSEALVCFGFEGQGSVLRSSLDPRSELDIGSLVFLELSPFPPRVRI